MFLRLCAPATFLAWQISPQISAVFDYMRGFNLEMRPRSSTCNPCKRRNSCSTSVLPTTVPHLASESRHHRHRHPGGAVRVATPPTLRMTVGDRTSSCLLLPGFIGSDLLHTCNMPNLPSIPCPHSHIKNLESRWRFRLCRLRHEQRTVRIRPARRRPWKLAAFSPGP